MGKTKKLKRTEVPSSQYQFNWIRQYAIPVFAIFLSSYFGYKYSVYVNQLHENAMWFSHIKQVEREISFRTETGLYYSYYKQMVLAPSISEGWYQLTHDNKTEHLRTINIVERFNIYQEIFLAVIYRILPQSWKASLEYVYLYLYTIYGLQSLYLMAVFMTAWMLGGTFMAGVLANAFYLFNRVHMSRVKTSAPLRECTALPFIFIQIAAITFLMRRNIKPQTEKICLIIVAISTFCFTIIWQFAQFILLLQSFAIYGVYVLEFVHPRLLRSIFMIFLLNLVSVCVLMFGNDMLYSSVVFSFSIATLLLLYIQKDEVTQCGYMKKLGIAIARIIAVFLLTFVINFSIKKVTNVESDEHVFKFVLAKLGYGEALKTRDFDARLYLCNGAFQYMPFITVTDLTHGILFPVYLLTILVLFVLLAYTFFGKTLRCLPSKLNDYPELVFNLLLNIFLGIMAVITLRMKYIWMPHMAIFAAGVVCHCDTWNICLQKFEKHMKFLIRHSVPVLLIALLLYKKLAPFQKELNGLYMFKDKDTVDLMEWIKNSTAPHESFSGTMQLMAGVKLCTDRPITNHPHYENKFLRQRTKEIYQIYGKRTPEDVHKILQEHGSNYIILENSICYSPRDRGCRPIDIVDLNNGLEIEEKGGTPRFCHEIKRNSSSFRKYFKKVFENKTFYLYKVL